MNILIIGCNGFIGSNAYRFFKRKGNKVIGVDIANTQKLTDFITNKEMSNFDSLFSDYKFDVCINASGSSTVRFAIENKTLDFELNCANVEKIAQYIHTYQPSCKLVNLSSAAVYGNPKQLPIKETDTCHPISVYGKHKLFSEKLIHQFVNDWGLHAISLRIFSVYGNGLAKQLFWDIYQKSKLSNTIELYGTGEETRDFIHSSDLMIALECVIQNASFKGEAINVASGVETSVKQAAETLIKYYNPELKLTFNSEINENDPKNWRADISILTSLSFNTTKTIDEGLKNYATWLNEKN